MNTMAYTKIAIGATLWAFAAYVAADPFIPGGVPLQLSEKPEFTTLMELDSLWAEGTYRGVPFKILPDGSGHTAEWERSCEQDAMTDIRLCTLTSNDLMVVVGRNGVVMVTVGFDRFPRSTISIRIDEGAPLSTLPTPERVGWLGAGAVQIGRLIAKANSSVKTRYIKWPSKVPVDGTVDPRGFTEAVEIAKWAVNARPTR